MFLTRNRKKHNLHFQRDLISTEVREQLTINMVNKDVCYICEDEVSEADSIKCDGICERTMHAKCIGMNKTVRKAYCELDNLYYMCNECIGDSLKAVNNKLNKILSVVQIYDERIARYESDMREVKESVNGLKSGMLEKSKCFDSSVSSNNTASNNKSENSVTSKNMKRKAKSKNAIVLVKPKNSQNCELTERDFKQQIDPNLVQVNRLRKGPKGGLAVVCESQLESDKLEKIAIDKLGENYIIEPQKEKSVMLKITDIGEELSEDELISALKKQNEFIADKQIKMLNFYKVNSSKSFSAIIEANSETSDMILENGFVKIMFSRCRVFEYVKLNRCYKCQGYSHKAAECRHNRACKKCSGDHDLKVCESNVFKCVNCKIANEKFNLNLNENHKVSSVKCAVLNKKIKAMKGKVQFSK